MKRRAAGPWGLAALATIALALGPGSAPAQLFPVLDPVRRPTVTGPTDSRFFGTFCQAEPKKFCKSIPILPDPCATVSDMRVHLDVVTFPRGDALSGGGRFRVDGKQGFLAIAGNVAATGRARFAASAPGLGDQTGEAVLTSQGLELRATVQGRTLVLRKDACGNQAPRVTLNAPSGPTFPFGQTILLSGRIMDEDSSFPVQRLVFTSDRQGLIAGTRTGGNQALFTNSLVPGAHHVTLTVTDSGGLIGRGSIDIAVVDRPPGTPRIFLPAEGATLSAGAPVLLSGNALDPDTGVVPDSGLAWSAQLQPGGPFVPLGSGHEGTTAFANPADPVRIRLTATSSGGQQSQAERTVRVVAGGGDAPPIVVIRQPDRLAVDGNLVAGFFSTDVAHFVAVASDVEDAGPALQLRWRFEALTGLDGPPDPSPPIPNPPPVTGSLTADVTFPVVGNLFYRVTFEATDSAGQTSTDSIQIFVTSNVIL